MQRILQLRVYWQQPDMVCGERVRNSPDMVNEQAWIIAELRNGTLTGRERVFCFFDEFCEATADVQRGADFDTIVGKDYVPLVTGQAA